MDPPQSPSILVLADERQDIQKKTFTKWINAQLSKVCTITSTHICMCIISLSPTQYEQSFQTRAPLVVDLFEDLRDGTALITLLNVLTNEKLKPQRGTLVFHRRNNINAALQVLQDHGVKLVNLSSDDIEAGNPKLTLALIWLIALSFNGQQLVNNLGATSLEKNLLSWATGYTQKYGLQVRNFHSSWSDGRAFLYILHETLPNTVDLQRLLALPAIGRLQQSFAIARQHLAIDQLLDPEDVHTTKPDKKSILMYVMSIYHTLQQTGGRSDGGVEDVQEETACIEVFQNPEEDLHSTATLHSRPMSTATNVSVEISSYQTAIEEVLTLLLESEEVLSRDIPAFNDLDDAKSKFREHEEFMLKLSHHQRYVGAALEEGDRLISESQLIGASGGLSLDEQNEIKQQMFLLNERWETLRIQAMDVQSKIHSQLAEVESRKIEDLRDLLTDTEDRISRFGALDPTSKHFDEHFRELQELQGDLEEQQKLVDSLSNLIVIVDDETQNFHDLEDKLAALGERWSHVIEWTKLRLETVHKMRESMAEVSAEFAQLKKWINTRERELKLMESKEVSEMGDGIRRVRELEYCSGDMVCCAIQIGNLDVKVRHVSPSGQPSDKWVDDIEDLIDRNEALKQMIDVQKSRLADMGFEFSGVADKPSHWIDFQAGVNAPEVQVQSKKAKWDKTENILDLEFKIIDILNFIDSFNASLNRIQDHSGFESCSEQLRDQLKQRIKEYASVRDLLNQCKGEGSGDLSVEEKQLHSIGSKYDEFVFRLEDIDNMVFVQQANRKFHASLTGLKLVLAELRDWHRQNSSRATVEELEEKVRNMDTLSKDIIETKNLCENNTDPQSLDWKEEFGQFLQSWKDMKHAIQRMISEQYIVPENHLQAEELNEVHQLLERCEATKVIYNEIEVMNANILRLNELSEKVHHIESDGLEGEVVSRMQEAIKGLKSKIMGQTIIVENVHHFRKEHENILVEIGKLERAINQNDFELTEMTDIEKLHEKFKLYGIEIKKLEIDIISLKNFCEIITTNDYCKYTEQLKDIVHKHGDLVELYKDKKSKIKSVGPSKSQKVVSQIEEIEKWLTSLEKDTQPLDIARISNSNELFKAKLRYQNIKEVCDAKTIQFKEINESANEILIEVDEKNNLMRKSSSITNMVKALTKLNSFWNEVTNDIYHKAATLERASNQLGEFRTLITQESGYFDKLEQILNKSLDGDYADAEDICEELDDLENIIRNHSGERLQKIEEIGQELVEVQFMEATILGDVQSVKKRWDDLQDRANTRAHMLDSAAKEAQNSESKISYLLDWIAKVDVMLSEHIENDVGVDDLPHDFQVRLILGKRENL